MCFPLVAGIALATSLSSADILAPKKPKAEAQIVAIQKIWDRAPHSAFTDLLRRDDRWFCAFREGQAHVSPDGAIRVLSSADGERWSPWARLDHPVADLRDPKLAVAPNGQLMLSAAGAMHQPSDARHKTFVWYSGDGRDWQGPLFVGDPDYWLWRPTWYRGKAYGFGYSTGASRDHRTLRVYLSLDGKDFRALNHNVFDQGGPSETSMVFLSDGSALSIMRRDEGPKTALLGRSQAPYRSWNWTDLGVRVGGPQMLRLPDSRIVVASRLHEPDAHTALSWLDPDNARLTEFLRLPSSGDSSYPGLVFHDDLLWVSYYSTHENSRSSIYVAKVKLPPAQGN
jgi:hypothetical protein